MESSSRHTEICKGGRGMKNTSAPKCTKEYINKWKQFMQYTDWLDDMWKDGYLTTTEYENMLDNKRKELGI